MNLLKFQILSGSAQLNWSPVPATAELRPAQPHLVVKTPTPTQHNTTVGFDMKMTLQTPPTTHHHRNFSGTSRRARELKFGTDTH